MAATNAARTVSEQLEQFSIASFPQTDMHQSKDTMAFDENAADMTIGSGPFDFTELLTDYMKGTKPIPPQTNTEIKDEKAIRTPVASQAEILADGNDSLTHRVALLEQSRAELNEAIWNQSEIHKAKVDDVWSDAKKELVTATKSLIATVHRLSSGRDSVSEIGHVLKQANAQLQQSASLVTALNGQPCTGCKTSTPQSNGYVMDVANTTGRLEAERVKASNIAITNMEDQHDFTIETMKHEHYERMKILKQNHVESIEKLKLEHANAMDKVKAEHADVIQGLKAELKDATESIRTGRKHKNRQLKGKKAQVADFADTTDMVSTEQPKTKKTAVTAAKDKHNFAAEKLKADNYYYPTKVKDEHKAVTDQHKGMASYIADLNDNYHRLQIERLRARNAAMVAMEDKHDFTVEKMKADHYDHIGHLKFEHTKSTELLKNELKSTANKLKVDHQNTLQKLMSDHQVFNEVRDINARAIREELETEHAEAMVDLKTRHKQATDELKDKHHRATRKMYDGFQRLVDLSSELAEVRAKEAQKNYDRAMALADDMIMKEGVKKDATVKGLRSQLRLAQRQIEDFQGRIANDTVSRVRYERCRASLMRYRELVESSSMFGRVRARTPFEPQLIDPKVQIKELEEYVTMLRTDLQTSQQERKDLLQQMEELINAVENDGDHQALSRTMGCLRRIPYTHTYQIPEITNVDMYAPTPKKTEWTIKRDANVPESVFRERGQ